MVGGREVDGHQAGGYQAGEHQPGEHQSVGHQAFESRAGSSGEGAVSQPVERTSVDRVVNRGNRAAQRPASITSGQHKSRKRAKFISTHFVISIDKSSHPTSAAANPGAASGVTLIMAIPKKVLRRAVDRNAVKRVVREAWRVAQPSGPIHGLGRVHVRLTGRPADFATLGRPGRKRLWRLEFDELLARMSG